MIKIHNANKLPAKDLRQVARFFAIIKNYQKMRIIQDRNNLTRHFRGTSNGMRTSMFVLETPAQILSLKKAAGAIGVTVREIDELNIHGHKMTSLAASILFKNN